MEVQAPTRLSCSAELVKTKDMVIVLGTHAWPFLFNHHNNREMMMHGKFVVVADGEKDGGPWNICAKKVPIPTLLPVILGYNKEGLLSASANFSPLSPFPTTITTLMRPP